MPTAEVRIVALRLPNMRGKGYHTFSIEIVPKENAKSVIKKRRKEKYEVDDCILPSTSPDIELLLDKDKKCEVKFTIRGGLKPAADMHDGEDIILYSAKKKTDARKILVTIPSNESEMASIIFTVGDTFKHRVNIVDVPCKRETVSPGLAAVNISGGATSENQTTMMMSTTGDQTELKAPYNGCDTSYDAGYLAKPVFPRSGVTSVPEGAMAASFNATTLGGESSNENLPLIAKPVSPALVVQSKTQAQFTIGPGPSVQEEPSYEPEESANKKLRSNKLLKDLASRIRPKAVFTFVICFGVPLAFMCWFKRGYHSANRQRIV